MSSMLSAPTLRTIPGSRCERCKRLKTLAMGIERVMGQAGVLEMFVICQVCGLRVHAAYTNEDLEQEAARLRGINDLTERLEAVKEFKRRFEAFNVEMVERFK